MSTLPDPEGRKLLRIEVRNSQTPIEKKPEWIRTTAKAGENYQDMRSLSHAKGLHTVCAEAGSVLARLKERSERHAAMAATAASAS